MARADDRKAPRRFKSAEKPVSLHPLSFKQAVIALLEVGPIDDDPPSTDDPAPRPPRPRANSARQARSRR